MGLDMYLSGRQFNHIFDEQEAEYLDGKQIKAVEVDLGYWRKHPNLHGFIVNTFANGIDECQRIELGVEELNKIIQAIKDRTLPHTEGFFFGKSEISDEQVKADVAIFEEALLWITFDKRLRYAVYQASW